MSTKSDKYVGRVVAENGTDRTGIVANAWQLPEGVVGLFIRVDEWQNAYSDSEHWTIVRPLSF